MGTQLNDILQPSPTGHICSDCEADITYTEETFLIEIVQPQVVGPTVFCYPVKDEHDPEGDFLYEPHYYCFKCWENHYDELRKEVADSPPVNDPQSDIECVCCASGIRSWEQAGMLTLGEFHLSKRAPNGVRGPRFEPVSKPEILCLYCLSIFNDNYIIMWDDLSQDGECCDCILARCWRHGPCGCGCHLPDTEFDVPDDTDDQRT